MNNKFIRNNDNHEYTILEINMEANSIRLQDVDNPDFTMSMATETFGRHFRVKDSETFKRGDVVRLMGEKNTMGGVHPFGGKYKVLGYYGAGMIRLSRVGDNAKLICEDNSVVRY